MRGEQVRQQLATVRQQAQVLHQQMGAVAGLPPHEIPPKLEELQALLERLRQAEEELAQQQEELVSTRLAVEVERQRYQDLFDCAPDGYVITDPQGVIQEANRTAAALVGSAQDALIGKPFATLVVRQDRLALRKYLHRLRLDAPPRPECEVGLQPRGGAPVPVALTVAVVRDPQGNVLALRWLMRESTLRKQAEEALRRAKEAAERADRTKSEFLATMSHELRTPLGVIIGYDDLLLEEEFGPVTTEQRHVLQRMGHNAKALLDLIAMLLDLSRLEAGRLPVELQTVQLRDVVEDLQRETQETQAHSGLTFVWTIAEGLPTIETDPQKLKIVLRNLLGNAVKFTTQGCITVTVQRWERGVEVQVRDTGMGIPPEALAVIFEPFQQGERAAPHRTQGTGLGLHIVRRLLELLGGSVTVESEVGRGSLFCVRLPFRPPSGATQEVTEAREAGTGTV